MLAYNRSQLQRARFGRRSERLDPDQMALVLEELDDDLSQMPFQYRVFEQTSSRASHETPSP
ncbi:MAG: hypothetical protein HKN11_09750 [Rhizobiales bacterium]|nr:hypothetical protein [Hyphomicrobiales bacterium]